MKEVMSLRQRRYQTLAGLASLALCVQAPLATAQNFTDSQNNDNLVKQEHTEPLPPEKHSQGANGAYILGPGDGLQIDVLDLPELSGEFNIGPDGTLYLPRLRSLFVEGLTIDELRSYLTKKFNKYVRNPEIYIRPIIYRPIRFYVGGEVKRPGYYTLGPILTKPIGSNTAVGVTRPGLRNRAGTRNDNIPNQLSSFGAVFPTVFDAISSAQGVTPYTDLSEVEVTRKRAEGLGGGRIRTKLNFISLITEGDESQNIRLFDGDVLQVGKSPIVLREQLLKAGQSNISPQFMSVFVTGRVNVPGPIEIPQGSTLNQAISIAGGTKLLKGRVEFIRFNREGSIDRRVFSHRPSAKIDSPNNPVLVDGDVIRVRNSLISGGVEVLGELTAPFAGVYSAYSIFSDFDNIFR